MEKDILDSAETIRDSENSGESPASEPQLLPCPFCGGEPKWFDETPWNDSWVECTSCNACSGIKDSGAEAIAAWNRRPSPSDSNADTSTQNKD